MKRQRISAIALLTLGTTLAMVLPSNAAAARRNLTVFGKVTYAITPWTMNDIPMATPPGALEFRVRVKSKAPTVIDLRGSSFTVPGLSVMTFNANKKLGIKPFRTPFTIRTAPERNRTSGVIKWLK